MSGKNPYERDLDRNGANYVPLTPLSLIARTAYTYPEQLAVVHGERRYTWSATYARSRALASALSKAGIVPGDTVSVMAANTPEMVEAHFGVPMTGAVLNTLNTRLDPDTIAFMLRHSEAKVLITDTEFSPTIENALQSLQAAFSGGHDLKEMMANRTQDFVGGVRAVQPRDAGDAGDAANRDRPRAWHCHGRRAARSWPLAIST
jgi:acyl-CoA synthetase (AMP-forming)/AMP-acid ligase II